MPTDDPIILNPPKKQNRLSSRQYAIIREGHFEVEGAAVMYADSLDEAVSVADRLTDESGRGWQIYALLP